MSQVVVVGDVHGDLNQLLYPLFHFFENYDKCKKIVFLGDYIDRGESTVFIYEIIKSILSCPEMREKVIFLRGNHESYEGSVYDYMNTNIAVSSNTKAMIKSFMLEKVMKLDLKLTHYDDEANILYSHAPLNRGLDYILSCKDSQELTYTSDRETNSMTYRNIHGHDHKFSSKEQFDKFMRGERKMVSLDCDASYGIRMIANSYKSTRRWLEKITSNVKWLVMYDGGKVGSKFEIMEDVIKFNSERDLNTKPFEEVKRKLLEGCGGGSGDALSMLRRRLEDLNYEDSVKTFRSEYLKLFKDDRGFKSILYNMRKLYANNLKKSSGINVYFNDVPIEVYQKFGLFTDMEYTPIYKLYWYGVLDFEEDGDEDRDKNINRRYSNTADENEGESWFGCCGKKWGKVALIVALVLVVIFIVGLVVYAFVSNSLGVRVGGSGDEGGGR